jgi:hypothetical protein
MKNLFAVVFIVPLTVASSVAAASPPNVYAANSGISVEHCGATPAPGTVIDAHNVSSYECLLPAAAIAVVKHGFKIRVAAPRKLEWPAGFKQATEKYSAQVHLDGEDNLSNYVAGMPFPLVSVSDPQAARKIAYNWHMGPFMPDDFSLNPWGSFGYSDDSASAKPVHNEPDYTYICDEFDFLRYAHRTQVEPRPTLGDNEQQLEWKARCSGWSQSSDVHGDKTIWMRFLDPHRSDENFIFFRATRRVRRQVTAPAYPDHNCRACHQPYWAYALPKTEAYSYRLLGTTPILACLSAEDEPAGFAGRVGEGPADTLLTAGDALAMGEEPFEMRSAYIIEMIPIDSGYTYMHTLVWIDTETYVWLGAEFFESNKRTETPELQEVALPLWRTHPAPGGGSLFDLAGSFYVPLAYQPSLPAASQQADAKRWFFRSAVPSHGKFDQQINSGSVDDSAFNPRSLGN